MVDNTTPIIVGIGQVCEKVSDTAPPSSPVDLAASAARKACEDAVGTGALRDHIDTVVGIRLFSDMGGPWPAPFGRAQNYPRAVAARLELDPSYAAYSIGSGDTPQKLIGHWCDQIHQQKAGAVLLVGSEATATLRNTLRSGATLDWSDNTSGQLEDQGVGTLGLYNQLEAQHGLLQLMNIYALLENARRARLKMDRESYAEQMGELFEQFSKIAASNPYAMFPIAYSARELITVSQENQLLSDPYTKRLVAKDGVNQAAAVVLTSVGLARELGIPEEKWVYLHGQANIADRPVSERPDIGQSDAMAVAYQAALQRADVTPDSLQYFDLYSCFPVAVSIACECLGISRNDPRHLTVTGGLPFFGGPGNNYTMHAIASMVEKLRASPESLGLIGANGGLLTKHSVGIYGARPPRRPWQQPNDAELQGQLDLRPEVELETAPNGRASIETYTITYSKGKPSAGLIIGRMSDSGKRFVATTPPGDADSLAELETTDPIGRSCFVLSTVDGNRIAFQQDKLEMLKPPGASTFRDSYEYCLVERNESILEVRINRPEHGNCLHPMANDELNEIFDIFEDDHTLHVAILTGAENGASDNSAPSSFCAGSDLEYMASGKRMWVPAGGFGGITHRRRRVKPVIAAVNGYALGGGMEIVLACDMAIVADNAAFALPAPKVGSVAENGGVQRLTRQLPRKVAMEILLTGRHISAEEAREFGIVNNVVPQDKLIDEVRKLATAIAANAPLAIQTTMSIADESLQITDLEEAVNHHYRDYDRLLTSEDLQEGAKALAEKRRPNWRGR